MKITLGSLFDGSGGFPLAGALCDIEPVWASEIEPYPIAVTRSRFPKMLHLGDISKIDGSKIQPVQVISFGSPCQDLSISGLRRGLKHTDKGDSETTRSGLFMEAIRIIKEMRCATDGKYPRFAVWENVPGAFSSNKGEDFRTVLEEIIKINEPTATVPTAPKGKWPYADTYVGDGWSLAYRTFDAQYWGVPQRRRRIYLVADFAGRCATRVLFEREGLRGYFTQSPTPWQGTTTNAEGGIGTDDKTKMKMLAFAQNQRNEVRDLKGVSGCLAAQAGMKQQTYIAELKEHKETIPLSSVASTIRAGAGAPKHQQDFVGRLCIVKENLAFHLLQDPTSGKVSPCMGQGNSKNGQASIGVCQAVEDTKKVGFDGYNSTLTGDKSATLGVNCGMSTGRNGVVEKENHLFENHLQDARYNGPLNVSPTLQARLGTGGNNQPIVVEGEPVYCVQGNCIDRSDTAGCNGKGWREGASFTLNTIDRPAVVFAVDQGGGKSGAIFHHEVSPTLTCTHGGEPAVSYLASGKDKFGTLQANAGTKLWLSNQEAQSGDYHIIEEKPWLYRESSYSSYISGVGGTLRASGGANGGGSESLVVENKPLPDEIHEFVAENNADAPHQQDLLQSGDGVARTLACGTHGSGPHLTKTVIYDGNRYIVRRLTPVECARLQGFADSWGVPDYKESLTDEEYAFWHEVKNTYEEINGRTPKEYTREQISKWYNKLHTNGAEYKMWGNGVALPPTLYVMQGIYDVLNDERDD